MSALAMIEDAGKKAKEIRLLARLVHEDEPHWVEVTITHRYGWRLGPMKGAEQLQTNANYGLPDLQACLKDARQRIAGTELRPETIEVKTTKSPTPGKELVPHAVEAMCRAWGVPVPDEKTLATQRAAWRKEKKKESDALKAKKAKQKEKREAAKAKEAAREAERVAKVREAAKPSEAVQDLPSFLKAIEVRADRSKLKKALKMLKADRFELFNDVRAHEVVGVVKSQGDANLRYACRLGADGSYSCCTQNLNVCGGLRGSLCKHLLVLVVGLVQARELDPVVADGWIAQSLGKKPVLDRDAVSEVFLRYQGAEAGEVDWRPTETMPEDFYAF